MASVESATYPKKAGAFKLGELIMINSIPCKITILNKSKAWSPEAAPLILPTQSCLWPRQS